MDILVLKTILSIKLWALLFILVSFLFIYFRVKKIYFLFLVGIASSLACFLLFNQLALPFWGLQGDEITLGAMYQAFSVLGPGVDFAYHHLPPFYPPAWFWFLAFFGKIFSLNGAALIKLSALLFFLFFPVVIYLFQKKNLVSFLIPLLILSLFSQDLLFGKPYEIFSGALAIILLLAVYRKVKENSLKNKEIVLYSLGAALIFMTYYLSLFFVALALLPLLFNPDWKKRLIIFLKMFLLTLLFSSPYIYPLVKSFIVYGFQSWQTAFFVPAGIVWWLPMFSSFNLVSLIFLFGLASLFYYRQKTEIRPLLFLLGVTFLWWAGGLVSLFFWQQPFQEFRGFYILAPMTLIWGAAYGIQELFLYFKIKEKKNLYLTSSVLALLFFFSRSIFGFFLDDPVVSQQLTKNKGKDRALSSLVSYLKTDPQSTKLLTLNTVPQVSSFVPLNNFIYFNQHNNHPAANFSGRLEEVFSWSQAASSEDLCQQIKNSSFGEPRRFIFYSQDEYFYLFFHLDSWGQGIKELEMPFPKKLFSSSYFHELYNQDGYVVLEENCP